MPEAPQPEPCEAATCRKRGTAVVLVSGDVANPDGVTRRTITLKLCAECAGPLLRVGQPLGASMSYKVA